MSRSWRRQRAALFAGAAAGATGAGPELVGRDFAGRGGTRARRRRSRARLLVPLLLGVVVASLGLTALRMQVLRLRYDLAEAVEAETRLLERQRAATVRVEALRDPARLHRLAGERGWVRPTRVVELGAPGAPSGPVR